MSLKDEVNEFQLGKATAGGQRHRPAYSYRKSSPAWERFLVHDIGVHRWPWFDFTPLLGIGSLVGIAFIFWAVVWWVI